MSEPEGPARPHVVARTIDHAKRHPVVLAVSTLVAVLLFLGTVGDLYGRISGAVGGRLNPHQQEYERLAHIDLGVTPQFLEGRLGTPRRSVDLCREIRCPPEAAGQTFTMNLYRSDVVAVRALFAGSSLEWYTITVLSDDVQPPVRWLGHDLGALGEVTFAQALEVAEVEPTDVQMHLGPQSSAYVEVVSGGAMADYRGLVLASAPDGWPRAEFDRESAKAFDPGEDAPYDPQVAAPFRSASQPDTFGEFVDGGGVVSVLAREASFTQVLLHTLPSG